MAIIVGTPGDDLNLIGTIGDDQINGGDGNDRIFGLAGDDVLDGGAGNDELYGDEGDDRLRGGSGIDILFGGAQSDFLEGGSGDDRLHGDDGQDVLEGGSGSDALFGGAGADLMRGGADNDYYLVDDLGDIVEETAGGGHDEVYVIGAFYALGANIETLVLLTPGSTGVGNASDNILIGTSGNETLNGLAGADTMIGGMGDDLYIVDNIGDRVIEAAGGGRDRIETSVGNDGFALAQGVEDLTLLNVAGAVVGVGNSADNVITGNALDNMLLGLEGNDTLIGGIGNDSYSIDSAGDMVVELAGQGTDTVVAYGTANGYVLSANVENLVLLDDAGIGLVTSASGNDLANTMTGNRLGNTLDGGSGDDVLEGLGGNDVLRGGIGRDRLSGGDGDDRLIGGAGADMLFGGAGADSFALSRRLETNDFDRVFDFIKGTDRIEIDRAQFGNIGPLIDGINFFANFASAVNSNGPTIIMEGTRINFDPDGRVGPQQSEFVMFLETAVPLTVTVTDFILI